jgi:fructokinase
MRLGIDLGGTKIAAAVLDAEGRMAVERRVPTPHSGYDDALATLAALILDTEKAAGGRCRVGVGMPGSISPRSGRVFNAYNTPFNGRRLKHDLEQKLGRETRFANDANCFALSEATDGAGAGAACVFGVILGTGVGGGVVAHGRVLTGANAVAGEWGHNAVPWPEHGEWPGPPCYCGRSGCIETFLSGPGLAADHVRRGGAPLDAAEIAARAAQGDAACEETLRRYESRIARALAGVINVLDPDVIVLGGGLSRLERLYANVPGLWPRHVFSDRVDTRLAPPLHGDSSGVRGAAWLWP